MPKQFKKHDVGVIKCDLFYDCVFVRASNMIQYQLDWSSDNIART